MNEFGKIVCDAWLRSAEIRRAIQLTPDELVVMPDHIHGIVWIDNVGATGRSPLPNGPMPRSLASFIARNTSHWDWLKIQEEGQCFERKSCYDRSGESMTPRKSKDLIRDVTEALLATANAEGGSVALGVEDDGRVTGVPPQLKMARVTKNGF